ncbi:MAG: HNH endonuclease [Collimonas pratensis]|uniref:hypothetical protein n=1 Tax=Collimonas pratensis TaxID=279113 RepID=UPI003C736AEA
MNDASFYLPDPPKPVALSSIDEARFWSRVNKDGPIVRPELGPCWIWTAATNDSGYGLFYVKHQSLKAHRVGLGIAGIAIPHGALACHKCDVRNCVRPSHIFFGTKKDNADDAINKGRHSSQIRKYGDTHPQSKLTATSVRLMRRLHSEGIGFRNLGKQFGVSRETAKYAVLRRSWAHVK